MLAELEDVLTREKFSVSDEQIRRFTALLVRGSTIVTPERPLKAVPQDPDDDIVLNTALIGRASHIVSGDRHLLGLGSFRGVRVVTVAEMLDLLKAVKTR
jgi:uncharacterized protein